MSSKPATGSEAWVAQLSSELRPAGLTGRTVGTAAEASAEELGTICYISSGIALSFERFALFWEPLNQPSTVLGLPAHREQNRAHWLLMHAAGWVAIDSHPAAAEAKEAFRQRQAAFLEAFRQQQAEAFRQQQAEEKAAKRQRR